MVHAPTALYRLYNAKGDLLYVGVTANLGNRFWDHQVTKGWWPGVASHRVDLYDHREEALMAERIAIKTEAPVFNLAGVEREEMPPNSETFTVTVTTEELEWLEVEAAKRGVTVPVVSQQLITEMLRLMRSSPDWVWVCQDLLGLDGGEMDHLWLLAFEAGMDPVEWLGAIFQVVADENMWDVLVIREMREWLVEETKARYGE